MQESSSKLGTFEALKLKTRFGSRRKTPEFCSSHVIPLNVWLLPRPGLSSVRPTPGRRHLQRASLLGLERRLETLRKSQNQL